MTLDESIKITGLPASEQFKELENMSHQELIEHNINMAAINVVLKLDKLDKIDDKIKAAKEIIEQIPV